MNKIELQTQMRILANNYRVTTERLEENLRKHKEYMEKNIIAQQVREDGLKKIYGAKPSMMVVDEHKEYVRDER